jgi:hypothetical protein
MTVDVIAFPRKRAIGGTPTAMGLSDHEFQSICRLCRPLPAGWLIERIDDPLDGLTAMLLRMSSDESIYDYGFVISREEEYLHLERLEGDDIIPLGIFCSVPMMVRFLRNDLRKPAPRAFHSAERAPAGQARLPSFLVWCAPNYAPDGPVKSTADRLAKRVLDASDEFRWEDGRHLLR